MLHSTQALASPWDDSRVNDPCDDIIEQANRNKSASEESDGTNSEARKEIIEKASNDFKDAQYSQSDRWKYGKSADCSSFVCMIYAKVLGGNPEDYGGYTVGMEKKFEEISESEAKAGDVVFWGKKGSTHHVAIYDGDGGIYEMKDPQLDWAHTKSIYQKGDAWFARLKNEGNMKDAYKKLNAGTSSSSSKKEGSSSSSSGSSKGYEGKIKTIYHFLHDKYGFSAPMIAGIIGNWQTESQITANRVEDVFGREATDAEWEEAFKYWNERPTTGGHKGPGLGLGQWTDGRNSGLREFAEKHYKNKLKAKELGVQLQYMVAGDDSYHLGWLKKLAMNPSKDPAQNGIYFAKFWEGNAGDKTAERASNSKKAYEDLKKLGLDDDTVDKKKVEKLKSGAKVDTDSAFDATSSEGASSTTNECGIAPEGDGNSGANENFGGGWTTQPFSGSKVPISSPYGHRDLAGSPWHDGVDWGFASLGSGRDIIAVHNAKVQYAGSPAKYGQPTGLPFGLGNYVIILSTGDYEIIYQEFAMSGGQSKVKTGDTVKAGQVIYEKAKQAPPVDHLHLSIIKGSGDDWSKAQADWQNPNSKYFVDPMKVLGKKEDGKDKKEDTKKEEGKQKGF